MKESIIELKNFIKLDQVKIISNIEKHLKREREIEENRILSNKERPSWNGNSIVIEKKNEQSLDSNNEVYDKHDLKDQRRANLTYNEIIKQLKKIKDVSSLEKFNDKYEKFFDELIKLKIDLIRSDLIFAKWNYSTNVLLAANKFKKSISQMRR